MPPCWGATESSLRRAVQHPLDCLNEGLDISQGGANIRLGTSALIVIAVEPVRREKALPDNVATLLFTQDSDSAKEETVGVMRQATLIGGGFHELSRCAPALLRRLREVPLLKLLISLRKVYPPLLNICLAVPVHHIDSIQRGRTAMARFGISDPEAEMALIATEQP